VIVLHAELSLFNPAAAAVGSTAVHVQLKLLASGQVLRPTTAVVVAG